MTFCVKTGGENQKFLVLDCDKKVMDSFADLSSAESYAETKDACYVVKVLRLCGMDSNVNDLIDVAEGEELE